MAVSRPVNVSPVQNAYPIVDLASGRATETFQFFLLRLWERTGGFTDDFFEILTVANLGTIQGLIATGQSEALARQLADVAAQGKLNQIDRLAAQVEALERRFGFLQGVATSSLNPQPRTRVLTFTQDDTYYIGSDVRSIYVAVVGGGGGGGLGATLTGRAGGGGGGGAGYSFGFLSGEELPASVPITVGAGGLGGTPGSPTATDGGYSSFGDFFIAQGGLHGIIGGASTGAGGGVTTDYGNLFAGGAGGDGQLTDGSPAPNTTQGAPGGGGGGGFNNGNGAEGGVGAARSLSPTGGGGAGGATGVNGDPGQPPSGSNVFLGPGYGGGGGGGASTQDGGNGGDGVVGGGGGGGGAIGTGGVFPGSGGNGGDGRVWVVENL